MRPTRIISRALAMVAFVSLASAPAGASTFIRSGIGSLTTLNDIVVHARVVDSHSYWNADHNFILTDVRVQPMEFLKGGADQKELVITVLGGKVGTTTALIVGGAQLAPGSEYILFVSRGDLPGAPSRLTIRDHAQGVFTVASGPRGLRAVSEAIDEALLPDGAGISDPPGGTEGLTLEDFARRTRSRADGR